MFTQPSSQRLARQCISMLSLLALLLISLQSTGCSTLAALGLPVSSGPNKVLRSAKLISESVTRAVPIPRELNETVLTTYLVEPGDVLYVEPAKFDSPVRLPGDQPVQPDGSISLGRFGNLNVVHKTIPQIQSEVQSIIETAEPKSGPINVRLINWDSKSFYVLGEVNSPGAFAFDGNETVLDAILEAGGLTVKANHHRVLLSRPTHPNGCRVVLPICYDQLVQLGDTSTNYQVMPGDRIFVSSISLADDIKASLFPFLETPCPKCSCPPVGCDPCNLPVPEYAQPHFYENMVPVESVPISPAPSTDTAPANASDEDTDLDATDDSNAELNELLNSGHLEKKQDDTPKNRSGKPAVRNPSFENFDGNSSTSRRALQRRTR